ncbi:MAG: outer membrane lipoprotein-sorting protein [Candidatus Cloacimonetes bacterium]|nr:outer membrane lipoprotein-sorting protein [Candidatus Cloacimonadota bacterium]
MRFLSLLLYILIVSTISSTENDDFIISIVKKVESQYQADTSFAVMQMNIKKDSWKRSITMNSWGKGRDKFLTKIIEPKKEKGTASLKIDKNMWNYLPKIDRVIKIPSSLMGDSWMGSHFTNDDLVKSDKVDELYQFSVLSKTKDQAVVESLPRKEAAVVWGKIIYYLDLTRQIASKVEYFDEDMELIRTMTLSDVKLIEGRYIPTHLMILPKDNPDEYTEIIYKELKLNIPLKRVKFSIRYLKKR